MANNNRTRFDDYLASDLDNDDIVKVKKIYIVMCGGKGADGLLFSQLMYWMPRAKVTHDGKKWVAKTYADWESEIGINERTARRIIDRLKEIGLIETAIYKFDGNPTTHIRVVGEMFIELRDAIADKSDSPEWTERYGQNGQNSMADSDSSLTETTTENTNKKKKKGKPSQDETPNPSDSTKPPTPPKESEAMPPKLKALTIDAHRMTKIREHISANPHFSEESEVGLGHQGRRGADTSQNAYSLLCTAVDGILAPPPSGEKNQTPQTRQFAAQVKEYLINSTYGGQKKRRATAQTFLDFIDWYAQTNPNHEYLPGFSYSGRGDPDERATKFITAYESYRDHRLTEQMANCTECAGSGMVVKNDEVINCDCRRV